MRLMESSLLRALETPRLMKRKVKCKGKSAVGGWLVQCKGSRVVEEKHTSIGCHHVSEEIRDPPLRSLRGGPC